MLPADRDGVVNRPNSGIVPPGVGTNVTATQYTGGLAPHVGVPPGGAPAPRPAVPIVPAAPKPPASVNPALTGPKGPPSGTGLIPISKGLKNGTTGQTTPNIGNPSGYNISNGVDTSFSGLLPQGFDMGDLMGSPVADANTPAASSYVNQADQQMEGPTSWHVTPDQTVQGQFAQLMEQGNPAIQAVMEETLRAHAGSGGRNNAMALSAATVTGAQVGLSIAAQDAQTFAQAGQFNANAANDFAKQMDQFIGNALLSRQNFDQGVAMLKDQTNQNIRQLYSQVEANAATQSTNLKSTIATLKAQTAATLEQMDKQFSQDVAKANLTHQFASEEAWQDYGRQVRLGYLSSVNTQQTALMQSIGSIAGNPNITAAQAQAAIKDAIDQFNSYMTMNNAYYSSMVPGNTAGATGGTYGSAAWDYSIA